MKNIGWIKAQIVLNLRSIYEYRTAFYMQVFGMMINNVGFLLVWSVFFQMFNNLNGWQYADMLALNGIVAICYGICFGFANGIRRISRNVYNGQIDRFLVLPKDTLLSVAFSESHTSALGDLLFGLLLLIIYIFTAQLQFAQMIILFCLTGLSSLIFSGFIIAVQSICFWIPNSQDLSDTLTEFMIGPSLYPNSAFTGHVRLFFIFIIPAVVISGLPIDFIKNSRWEVLLIIIGIALFWQIFGRFVFYRGLKRYESGNSVGTK